MLKPTIFTLGNVYSTKVHDIEKLCETNTSNKHINADNVNWPETKKLAIYKYCQVKV